MYIFEPIRDRILTEPVLFLALVEGVIGLIVVFGIALSTEQSAAILVVAGTLLSIIARQNVTPTHATQTQTAVAPPLLTDALEDADGALARVD